MTAASPKYVVVQGARCDSVIAMRVQGSGLGPELLRVPESIVRAHPHYRRPLQIGDSFTGTRLAVANELAGKPFLWQGSVAVLDSNRQKFMRDNLGSEFLHPIANIQNGLGQ